MSKRVLFLCTGNSCRSQMAEGWLRHLGGPGYEVFSAGTDPTAVNPLAIEAMSEAGVDISAQASESVDRYAVSTFDLVVTVCDNAKERCPVFPGGGERAHWGFDDPADAVGNKAARMETFRRVRDEIRERISAYLDGE